MGITGCHVKLRLSQLAPSPGAWRPMAPDACHLLGSTSTASPVLLSPVVFVLRPHCRALCQVLACWPHEGSKKERDNKGNHGLHKCAASPIPHPALRQEVSIVCVGLKPARSHWEQIAAPPHNTIIPLEIQSLKSKAFTCALTRAMNSRSQRARTCNFATCSPSCFGKRQTSFL